MTLYIFNTDNLHCNKQVVVNMNCEQIYCCCFFFFFFFQQLQQVGDIIKYRQNAGRFFCKLYKYLRFRAWYYRDYNIKLY